MQTNQRTKHILVRHHYLRELHDQNAISLTFVRSERNYADLLTKNLPEALFTKHCSTLRDGYLDPYDVTERHVEEVGTWRDIVLACNPNWDDNEEPVKLGGRML